MKGFSIKSPILKFIDIDSMQHLQERLAIELGVALIFAYNGQMLTNASNVCKFCKKYTMNNPSGDKKCKNCKIQREDEAKKSHQPFIMKCHARLTNFAVPIYIDNEYYGSILGGQVGTKIPEEAFYEDLAMELGIDKDEYLKELKNIRIHTADSINFIVNFLFLFTKTVMPVLCISNNPKLNWYNSDFEPDSQFKEWFTQKYGDIKNPISARELEILRLLVQGKNNSEIAHELCISVHTAKSHVSSIIEKFGVQDRVQVAVKAIKEGYVE
jgi:ligand-binding sensor protein/DNA-binding CsgD family transcriptional regulator